MSDSLPPVEYWEQELAEFNARQARFLEEFGPRIDEIYSAIREGRPIPEPSEEPRESDEASDVS